MPLAAAPYRASGLVRWHKTDMPTVFRDVRFQGQSGKHLLALLLELMTSVHWVKADIAVASVEI